MRPILNTLPPANRPPMLSPLDLLPLQMLPVGGAAHVGELIGDVEQVQRLEELGLRRGVRIEMVSSGSPCIIRLEGSRLCFRHCDLLSVLVIQEAVV